MDVITTEPDIEDSGDLYSWLASLLRMGAKMAEASQIVVRITLFISLFCLLVGLYVICWLQGYHWIWGGLFGVCAAIPVVVMGYYHWVLNCLKEAPEQLINIKDIIHRFRNDHPEETKEVLSNKLSSLGKWKTYRLIGRVLKDILAGASVTGNIKTLGAMASPLFWFSLVAAIVLTSIFSGCLSLAIIIIALV